MPTCLTKRAQLFVGLACLGLAVAGCSDGANRAPNSDASITTRFAGSPAAGVQASNFVLRDQRDQKVSLTAQRGRFVVLTFLYTHCGDVCPLIATQLNQALVHLGLDRSQGRVLAISTGMPFRAGSHLRVESPTQQGEERIDLRRPVAS